MHTSLGRVFILYLIAIVFAMFNLSNVKIDYVADFLPLFDVMIIYYFAVYQPQIFSMWFLFVLGLISDSLNGFPLGITSFCYIVAVKMFNALNQRTVARESFQQILQQFVAFAFVVLFLKWLLLSIYYFKFYNALSPLIQLTISTVLYVLMHKFFDYLNRKLLGNTISA